MAQSNRERVEKALTLLSSGLLPFVKRELQDAFPDRWLYAVGEGLDSQAVPAKEQQLDDVAAQLRVMNYFWKDVFSRTLGPFERGIVGELRGFRNDWAHMKPFTLADTARVLEDVERLLTAILAEEAIEAERQKEEVQRLRYEHDRRRPKKAKEELALGAPAAGLKPWREVVNPHPDVRTGRYQLAEFAADLAQVYRGEGSSEYRDPIEFFRRTYITEGLRQLLIHAVQRLAGTGGDPVVELQTNFGGGKTHSLLALYHLFSDAPASDLAGVAEVLEQAGVKELPKKTCRAVLVGTSLRPGQPEQKPDGITTHTLWGELAYQLAGPDGYELLRESDLAGTNPGSALNELLTLCSPCLILIDEWVAYARQLYGKDNLPAGTFDTHFTFAQALTEAARAVPGVLVVISIPASEPLGSRGADAEAEPTSSYAEVGGVGGLEALRRLKHVVGRMHSPWRPATPEEGFEIVRRRLFEEVQDYDARDAVVSKFGDLYRTHPEDFPSIHNREGEYERRLKAAYPIHPELFDRLFEDWSSLEKFQRTRGVLRLMATVIYELWDANDNGLLIMPGSLPLDSPSVQYELTRYLEEHWAPVIDKDIDGENSLPVALDRNNPNFKRYSATRRVARTIYLGSAPTLRTAHHGVEVDKIMLGCVQPGENPSTFGDALRRLSERATFLYLDGSRYWFSPQPTVARLARDREEQLLLHLEEVDEEIIRRLRAERTRGDFHAIHVAPGDSSQIIDEPEARLVILAPSAPHSSKSEEGLAQAKASEYLAGRGQSPRRYRNALVFLAADYQRLEELRRATAQYLAWRSIEEEHESLNLDAFQLNQARTRHKDADETVDGRIQEAYTWLLVPTQTEKLGSPELATLKASGSGALAVRAANKLANTGDLITQFGPTTLRFELDRVPLWRNGHVTVGQLWEDFSQYLYLPRLKDQDVLLAAVQNGAADLAWEQETFAYAESYDEEAKRYRGLKAGQHTAATVTGLVVRPDVARRQLDEERAAREGAAAGAGADGAGGDGKRGTGAGAGTGADSGSGTTRTGAGTGAGTDEPRRSVLRRFHGSVTLDTKRVGRDAASIAEEVIQHLELQPGASVEVTLEIEAFLPEGAPDDVVRTVMENCQTLKFDSKGFEEE